MSTSANSIEYTICKNKDVVGRFRINVLCKYPDYAELVKYQPLSEHTIQAWGYDEEEGQWEDEPQNLEHFLRSIKTNRTLKLYFAGEKTAEQILHEFDNLYTEQHEKMVEHLAQKREQRLKNE